MTYIRPDPPDSIVDEVKGFVTLGNDVDGWSEVCHSGVVATILDEVPSMLTKVNPPRCSFMTACLKVTFLAPLRTPSTIMVVSRLERLEGRKVYVESIIEDENGKQLAKASTLFVKSLATL